MSSVFKEVDYHLIRVFKGVKNHLIRVFKGVDYHLISLASGPAPRRSGSARCVREPG